MSITKGVNECIWLHNLIHSLDLKVDKLILFCDSHSASCLVKYPIYHLKTKHIDVRLNFIRDILEEEMVSIQKINIKENLTDMLKKSLPTENFKLYLDLVDIHRS